MGKIRFGMELFNHLKEQLSNKTKISSNYIGRNTDIPKFFFTQIRKIEAASEYLFGLW